VAIQVSAKEADIKCSARLFGEEIIEAMRAFEAKKGVSAKSWSGKLPNFVTKLFGFTLLITGTVSGVILSVGFSYYSRLQI
jgi:hypothetical protein